MGRPRKNPDDPKWFAAGAVAASPEILPPTLLEKGCGEGCNCKPAPAATNDDLMVAVLMAGYIARGGPLSHDMMLRQARELIALIKAQ